jgi:hypothetical protein
MDMSGQLYAWQLYLQESAPSTHRIAGWVGRRNDLDTVEKKKKNHLPLPGFEPRIVQHIAY